MASRPAASSSLVGGWVQDAKSDAQSSRFSRFFALEPSPVASAEKARPDGSFEQPPPLHAQPHLQPQHQSASYAAQALFNDQIQSGQLGGQLGRAPTQAGAQHLLQQLQAGGIRVSFCGA